MKLWKLTRERQRPIYDSNHGFVVRAGTEADARQIASDAAADEGPEVWRSAAQSECVELLPDGIRGVILRDFNAG